MWLDHSEAGLLSMASKGPNQNGSEFFITLKQLPQFNGKNTVFGKIVKNMDILDEIRQVASENKDKKVRVRIIDCGLSK